MNPTVTTGVLVGTSFTQGSPVVTGALVGTSFTLLGQFGAVTTGVFVANKFVSNSGAIATGRYRR